MRNLKKYLKWGILILILILNVSILGIIKFKYSENDVAARWSSKDDSAHIGVYISKEQKFSEIDVMRFRENFNKKLMESDVHIGDNGNSTWTDCYSTKAGVTISNDKDSFDITAYGVGSDFFLFHPFTLLNGSYFFEDNLSKDLVLLDEDIAWRFFGSTDIEGMEIYINGKRHIISGVIARDKGMFQKAAGNSKSSIYMSYESLKAMESDIAITSYEIVMPNLTKDYAKKIVKENIEISNSKCEIVECTDRYSIGALFEVLKNIGKRSMQIKAIAYPYWENVSRGIEDVCAILLVTSMLLSGILIIYVVIKLILYIVKNNEIIKEYTVRMVKKVCIILKDKVKKTDGQSDKDDLS